MDHGDDRLVAAFARAHVAIDRRILNLRQATEALLKGELDEVARGGAEEEAHKLAGSAGTFGLGRVSELALELEELLRRGVDSPPHRRRAERLVWEMSQATLPAEERDGHGEGGTGSPGGR
ncbi:MAG TPA: Hpt domain-containing protein [Pilimelia sp.]|nr:Hpt domain-containing protein [Pilimelia sp.]